MLTLNDGRTELWQWDTGRTLAVDADCSQVHFSNKVFGRSIDVDVVDGVATIPDILLQTDKDLNAWAFVGTAENGYTKISKTFKVNRRNKPADYVFTPSDQTSLEEIKEKIDYLESIQAPDAIKNAVEDYLEQNPVEAPVESVNGKTGEVELTSKDIGAQIADFVITMKSDEDGNLIPDKTWAEATEAHKAGRRLSCVYNSREYALDSFWEGEEAHFVHNSITDLTEQRIYFLLDGTAYWSTNKASTSTFPVASVNGQTGAVNLTASNVGAVPAPVAATVGQVMKVSAVDDTSKPTAWEPVSVYSTEEIDAALGAYITDIDTLVGGEA